MVLAKLQAAQVRTTLESYWRKLVTEFVLVVLLAQIATISFTALRPAKLKLKTWFYPIIEYPMCARAR